MLRFTHYSHHFLWAQKWAMSLFSLFGSVKKRTTFPGTLPLSVSLCPMHFPTKNRWFVIIDGLSLNWTMSPLLSSVQFPERSIGSSGWTFIEWPLFQLWFSFRPGFGFDWLTFTELVDEPYTFKCFLLLSYRKRMASNMRKASTVSSRLIIFSTFSIFVALPDAGQSLLWSQTNLSFQMGQAPPRAGQDPSKAFYVKSSSFVLWLQLLWKYRTFENSNKRWQFASFRTSSCWWISKQIVEQVQTLASWHGWISCPLWRIGFWRWQLRGAEHASCQSPA